MAQSIYVIDNDDTLKDTLNKMFKEEEIYKFKKVDISKF